VRKIQWLKSIPLEIAPRNPRAELRSRFEQAPVQHAEAVLAAYEVLQELHNRGVLEIMHGALAASDETLEIVVDNIKRRKRFVLSGIYSSGVRFSAASSRSGSRASSRPLPKALLKPRPSARKQSDCLHCQDDSSAEIASAAWQQPLISCRPLVVTCTRPKIRCHAINRS
jgi:hypothetical protein